MPRKPEFPMLGLCGLAFDALFLPSTQRICHSGPSEIAHGSLSSGFAAVRTDRSFCPRIEGQHYSGMQGYFLELLPTEETRPRKHIADVVVRHLSQQVPGIAQVNSNQIDALLKLVSDNFNEFVVKILQSSVHAFLRSFLHATITSRKRIFAGYGPPPKQLQKTKPLNHAGLARLRWLAAPVGSTRSVGPFTLRVTHFRDGPTLGGCPHIPPSGT